MLIRDFIEIPLPLEVAVAGVGDPAVWARVLEAEVSPEERTLFARFGIDGMFSHHGKVVEVQVGAPRRQPRGTIFDVQWQPVDGSRWFPVMQADVTLASLGANHTHVEFNGSYDPPGGAPGRVADRLVLHHVAEHAVRLVLTRLVEQLTVVAGGVR
jgi:hypothetical protein